MSGLTRWLPDQGRSPYIEPVPPTSYAVAVAWRSTLPGRVDSYDFETALAVARRKGVEQLCQSLNYLVIAVAASSFDSCPEAERSLSLFKRPGQGGVRVKNDIPPWVFDNSRQALTCGAAVWAGLDLSAAPPRLYHGLSFDSLRFNLIARDRLLEAQELTAVHFGLIGGIYRSAAIADLADLAAEIKQFRLR